MTIRKTGNLYQLRSSVGTIFQSHSLKEIEEYERLHGECSFFSPSLGTNMVTDSRVVATKFTRLIKL